MPALTPFNFSGLPLTVPLDFLGMSYMEYPVVGNSAVGLIKWGSMRMCQMVEACWSTIEPNADGNYIWTNLDAIITYQRQNGASVYFGLYGTPLGYVDNVTPNPTYTDAVTKGPWGSLGECGYPAIAGKNSSGRDGLTALTAVVTAIMNRYNSPTGAWRIANPTLGKGIQYWEPWNEPGSSGWNNGNTATSSGQRVSSFCWFSAAQLVDLSYTQRQPIKAIDPSVIFTSPGFSNGVPKTLFAPYFNANGVVNPSATGWSVSDAIAWHPYTHNPAYTIFENWTNDILVGQSGIEIVQSWQKSQGYNLPLWISEWGVDSGSATQAEIDWYAAPANFRYTWIARVFMTMAALGVQCVHPWNWGETGGSSGNSGDWQLDVNGVQKAYNDFATKVSGRTIISGSYGVPGTVTLNFSDGTSWTV